MQWYVVYWAKSKSLWTFNGQYRFCCAHCYVVKETTIMFEKSTWYTKALDGLHLCQKKSSPINNPNKTLCRQCEKSKIVFE